MVFAEVIFIVGFVAVGIVLVTVFDRRVRSLIVRATGKSGWRALGLVALLLVVGVLLGVAVHLMLEPLHAVSRLGAVALVGAYTGIMTVLLWPFLFRTTYASNTGSARTEFRQAGGSKAVARVLGWGGGAVSLLLLGFPFTAAFRLVDMAG